MDRCIYLVIPFLSVLFWGSQSQAAELKTSRVTNLTITAKQCSLVRSYLNEIVSDDQSLHSISPEYKAKVSTILSKLDCNQPGEVPVNEVKSDLKSIGPDIAKDVSVLVNQLTSEIEPNLLDRKLTNNVLASFVPKLPGQLKQFEMGRFKNAAQKAIQFIEANPFKDELTKESVKFIPVLLQEALGAGSVDEFANSVPGIWYGLHERRSEYLPEEENRIARKLAMEKYFSSNPAVLNTLRVELDYLFTPMVLDEAVELKDAFNGDEVTDEYSIGTLQRFCFRLTFLKSTLNGDLQKKFETLYQQAIKSNYYNETATNELKRLMALIQKTGTTEYSSQFMKGLSEHVQISGGGNFDPIFYYSPYSTEIRWTPTDETLEEAQNLNALSRVGGRIESSLEVLNITGRP